METINKKMTEEVKKQEKEFIGYMKDCILHAIKQGKFGCAFRMYSFNKRFVGNKMTAEDIIKFNKVVEIIRK